MKMMSVGFCVQGISLSCPIRLDSSPGERRKASGKVPLSTIMPPVSDVAAEN